MLIWESMHPHYPQNNENGRLTLLILTHEFHPRKGGIATFTEEMALASSESGFQVEVWAPRYGGNNADKPWPFTVRRLGMKGSQNLSCLFSLSKEIMAKRKDLRRAAVYLPEPGPISAMLYLQFFNAFQPGKLYLTFHGSEILKYHGKPHHRLLLKRLIDKAERIGAVSTFTHRLLISRFPEAESKAVLTPNALPSAFVGIDHRKAVDRQKVVILTVGRLHPRKGQNHILQALNLLPPEEKARVEFWIVGESRHKSFEREVRRLAGESDFPVKMWGPLDDDGLRRAYEGADIFAMTSINYKKSVEGFGLVYLEASAHGLPVVAHRVGGVSDAVEDKRTGLLVEPGDRKALADAFSSLICNHRLRRKLGETGRKWANQHSWFASVGRLFGHRDTVMETKSAKKLSRSGS